MNNHEERSGLGLRELLLCGLVSAVLGFAGAWAFQTSGIGWDAQAAKIRDYIIANPEILPEAMDALQAKETQARIGPLQAELETPYPGAVIGNPQGSVTLVEFGDYGCPACLAAQPHVAQLVAENPDLKIVVRELPIISEFGVEAARMALAAADQGKYAEFHEAMYAKGKPSPANIDEAAREVGLDLGRAKAAIAQGRYDGELQQNIALAQQLGFNGTPSWVVGDLAVTGVIGPDRLQDAIDAARESAEAS